MNIKYLPLLLCLVFLIPNIHANEFEWSEEDVAVWNKAIKRVITTPPCCGACPLLRMSDGKKIYDYLSNKNSTPEGAELFKKYDDKILEAVKFFDPERSEDWTKLFQLKENKP